MFPKALLGLTPQGFMRTWDAEGHVRPTAWANPEPFLARADVVVLSREDVGGSARVVADLAARARLLVVTDGWHGATVYVGGKAHQVPPRPAVEVDPTGAGDVFATAFLIHLADTGDPFVAARFASVVASMSVEALGIASIPGRAPVEDWLRRHA
jgi:sugar/nucleoside kinase (ribokinase family)